MIILAISLGIIFIGIIAIPILYVYYKNYMERYSKSSTDSAASLEPSSTIVTIAEGLDVDHKLNYVEYTDHIHDLVFGEKADLPDNPTSNWVKHISADAQSIDISCQDPIKMIYRESLYTKNKHNPTARKKSLPIPRYVTISSVAKKKSCRRKSFKLNSKRMPPMHMVLVPGSRGLQ